MDATLILIYIYIFIVGITVGSFLNVCILRIPQHESIVFGPSHCMSCGKRLHWYEMIPVFSWLALGGRCSGCKEPISPQYPLIEAANGFLWLLVFSKYEFTLDTVLGCAFASVLLVLSVIDARTREIPLGTSVFVLILGACRLLLHLDAWKSHLLGMVTISGILFLILMLSGGAAIGGGDAKLMAGCGLFLGFTGNLVGFFAACVIGSVIHLIRMRFFGAGRDLAMGPYLAIGAFLSFLWGGELISWYLGLLGL